MSTLLRSLRLKPFNVSSLNNLSGSTGEIFLDSTNKTLKIYTASGPSILANRDWVNTQISNAAYSLPTATTSVLGGVKVDGTTITITNGVISSTGGGGGGESYVLPTATTSVLGGVKVDGTTITITDGVISSSYTYSLPTASTTVTGGIKIDGVTLAFNGSGQLYYTGSGVGGYTLPTATTSTLGGVKVDGSSITITDGVISATAPTPYTLPTATTSVLGGVKIDDTTIDITDGVISVDYTTWKTGLSAQAMTVASLSDTSGTIAYNAATSRMATVTVTGTGRTFSNPTNIQAGSYIIIVKQDAGGSKTITTWGSAFKWPAGVAPVLSTTANTTDIFSFWCDGTNLYGTFIPDCR